MSKSPVGLGRASARVSGSRLAQVPGRPRDATPVSVAGPTVRVMCRAYIEAHVPLNEALAAARKWADGEALTLIAPSTRAVEAQPWLDSAGVAIGTTSIRHSRFSARPHGTVIGWCLNLKEVLEVESRSSVIGIVAVQAQASHAPWITAHDVERLAGSDIARVAEASKAIKAMVEGIGTVALLDPAWHETGIMSSSSASAFAGFRFPREVISVGHCCIEPSGEAGTTDLPVGSPRHVPDGHQGRPSRLKGDALRRLSAAEP